MCFKNGYRTQFLQVLKIKEPKLIDELINFLETHYSKFKHSSNDSLKNKSIAKALENVHKNFTVAPVDNAYGNIGFIFESFYIQTLLKELALTTNNTSKTYTMVNNMSELDQDTKCLPTFYWLPNFCKAPTKAKCIIAALKCSIKPLPTTINSEPKLLCNQIKISNSKSQFGTIQNPQPILNSLESLNKLNKGNNVSLFNFSTLHTNITYDKLLFILNEVIDFSSNAQKDEIIAINKVGANWVNNSTKKNTSFLLNLL